MMDNEIHYHRRGDGHDGTNSGWVYIVKYKNSHTKNTDADNRRTRYMYKSYLKHTYVLTMHREVMLGQWPLIRIH